MHRVSYNLRMHSKKVHTEGNVHLVVYLMHLLELDGIFEVIFGSRQTCEKCRFISF